MVIKINGREITKLFLVFFLIIVTAASFYITVFGTETERYGIINTQVDYVRLRAEPTTASAELTSIPPQTLIKINGSVDGNDGHVWYLTEYNDKIGYVRADLVVLKPIETTGGETTGNEAVPGETGGGNETVGSETTGIPGETTVPQEPPVEPPVINFEEYLTEQKFPEDYKVLLRALHEKYPNWIFKAHHTGIDFEYAVEQQSGSKSLVENSFPSSWKSVEGDAYDWESNTWKIFDGDRWVKASKEIIRHYMDPRNFLDDSAVFQFLDQSFDTDVQNLEGVKRIIKGSFMENDVIDTDGSNLNYAQAIFAAGEEYAVNPYVLASMILIEVGNQGSRIISGTVPGYQGYFNYFNIGAYNDGIRDAISRGLWYAKGGNTGATSYERPWNTRLKAIRGGAYFYSYGYLNVGQNTLYLKRYNVQGNNPFTHQYMTSVYASAVEGRKLSNGYSEELRKTPLSFYIPVFEKMPERPCEAPTLDGSPNMKLKGLSVSGYELTPDFDTEVLEYMLVVPPTTGSITVNAVVMESSAKVEGAGQRIVNAGTNVFEIKVTAGNGTVRVYKLTVAKESMDNFGDLTFTNNYIPKDNIVYGIAPGMTVGDFRKAFVSEGLVTVKNSAGNEKTDSDLICTGDTVTASSTQGVKYADYTASVTGDINGDGRVNISDLLKIRNKILGSDEFNQTQVFSGDIDGNGKVNISDLLKVRNHILGTASIV